MSGEDRETLKLLNYLALAMQSKGCQFAIDPSRDENVDSVIRSILRDDPI